MTDLNICVGKSYLFKELSPNQDRFIPFDIRTIIGELEEDTFEYTTGGRYFDSRGIIYNKSGVALNNSSKKGPQKLIRLLQSSDPRTGPLIIFQENLKDIKNNKKYLSHEDDEFSISIGNVYINRMGLGIFIDRMFECLCDNPKCQQISFGKYHGIYHYSRTGNCLIKERSKYPDLKSMEDLIYKKVG